MAVQEMPNQGLWCVFHIDGISKDLRPLPETCQPHRQRQSPLDLIIFQIISPNTITLGVRFRSLSLGEYRCWNPEDCFWNRLEMAFGDMSCFAPSMYLALLTLEETLWSYCVKRSNCNHSHSLVVKFLDWNVLISSSSHCKKQLVIDSCFPAMCVFGESR